jgi:hypothetical protein
MVVCAYSCGWSVVVVCGDWGRMVSSYLLDAYGHFLHLHLWEVRVLCCDIFVV